MPRNARLLFFLVANLCAGRIRFEAEHGGASA
jgi:hypothetical protein